MGALGVRLQTIVVGGGQSGLAMSCCLSRLGLEHVVLERAGLVERWRSERWDSLVMCNPRWGLTLPGFSYGGVDPDGYASRDEVVSWLERYAALIDPPLRCGVEVTNLRRAGPTEGGEWIVQASDRRYIADNVVVATGPFQRAVVPAFASELPPGIFQLPSNRYRNPDSLPPGAVLVVGSGSSGCQIAEDLADCGRRVFLSVSRHNRVPRRYRGRDITWWYRELGEFEQIGPPAERRVPAALTGAGGGHDINLRNYSGLGITLIGHVEGVAGIDGHRLVLRTDVNDQLKAADEFCDQMIRLMNFFARFYDLDVPDPKPPRDDEPPALVDEPSHLDLYAEGVSTIIWACGFDLDFSWIDAPVIGPNGVPVHQRGITSQPGLLFLGLQWLHKYKSNFIFGVGEDAEHLAEHVEARSRGREVAV